VSRFRTGIAPEDLVTTAATVGGRSVLNTAVLPQQVPVAYGNTETTVTYAAAATFGQSLITAANGQVTPAGAAPDPRDPGRYLHRARRGRRRSRRPHAYHDRLTGRDLPRET
jgi:hypothetical protein